MRKRKTLSRESKRKRGAAAKRRGRVGGSGRKRDVAVKRSGTVGTVAVDKYLAKTPEPAREVLREMREAIRAVVPAGAAEVISYKIPAFRHRKVLVWYAAFAEHCSLFPTAAVIEEFRKELKGYKTSKGTIQFPLREPLPVALIKRIVKARVAAAGSR